ncbi:hypothetical protein [Winogradskyella haliclonae]|uniref:Uncharacterized protein n=1 Tax=Winogradskyella haliclonae TaxID=2048558 RepID=A0ABQ2BV51_9FLAO|nr:hypothetical protein [Winogradskyella haliclonae]GGI55700.1 hypothetical protein GCM10011444_00090 [Winogradskyella haliclonae]
MKTFAKCLILTFILCSSLVIDAQMSNDFLNDIESEKIPMLIHLKNGSTFRGNGYIKDNDVYFTRDGDKHTKTYNDLSIKSLDIKENGNIVHFDYKLLSKEDKRARLLRLVSTGKINLYLVSNSTKRKSINTNPIITERSSSLPKSKAQIYKKKAFNSYLLHDLKLYYFSDKETDVVRKLRPSKYLFKKNHSELKLKHFSKCPTLLKDIEGSSYRLEDITRTIDIYNNACK